jgi:hypothetical protein
MLPCGRTDGRTESSSSNAICGRTKRKLRHTMHMMSMMPVKLMGHHATQAAVGDLVHTLYP